MTTAPVRRRLLVIFNPIAGRRARRRLDAALGALSRLGVAIVVRETHAPGDAEIFARGARASEFDAIAVAGGDGTMNEVVNGLVDPNLPIGLLSFGTANVLAHEIGLPRDPRRLAEIVATGPARRVALGEAVFEDGRRTRRFLLMTGIGFDAEVVEALDLGLKQRIGKLAFAWSILVRLWCYRPEAFLLDLDGDAHREAASVIATRARCYGGHFILAPAARLSEPSFQLAIFKRAGRWAALRALLALGLGLLHRQPDFEIATARSVRLSGPEDAPVQIDGDVLGHLPVTLRIARDPVLLTAGRARVA
jgi:YegS/Rv2252/BmrU family lipid kinase